VPSPDHTPGSIGLASSRDPLPSATIAAGTGSDDPFVIAAGCGVPVLPAPTGSFLSNDDQVEERVVTGGLPAVLALADVIALSASVRSAMKRCTPSVTSAACFRLW
jgi:hypothetical protein